MQQPEISIHPLIGRLLLTRAGFADLLLKIEKRPTSPETVRFRGDFGRFC